MVRTGIIDELISQAALFLQGVLHRPIFYSTNRTISVTSTNMSRKNSDKKTAVCLKRTKKREITASAEV